jgi:uncharacterized membrane protein YsdA (DUF1294 family)
MVNTVLIIINIFAFVLCLYDKSAAKLKIYRIPERVFLSVAACFGSLGVFCGMYLFRHKTRHKKFIVLVPLFRVVQVAILGVLGIIKFVPPGA